MFLRVSATDIDALRYYREREDGDLVGLLAQLRREAQPTTPMLAGSAFHKALEHASDGDHAALEADGYTFDIEAEGEIALPSIREMKATREYLIDGCTVTLVGKVDAIQGRTVIDHKMTGRFDPERFLNSMQWRVYLDVFDADEFRWNVFEAREAEPGRYRITAIHPLTMHRYPGMGEDIERELHAFVAFIHDHLPEKVAA